MQGRYASAINPSWITTERRRLPPPGDASICGGFMIVSASHSTRHSGRMGVKNGRIFCAVANE